MIYTVTFNPAIDYIMHASELQQGKVNRSQAEELYWGGKGINVSTVLHNLGIETTALGFVAGFTGTALEQGLQSRGLKTDFVRLPSGMTRINVKIKSAQETDLNAAGPVIPEESLKQLYLKLDRMESGDVLCLSGSIPCGLAEDTYEKILAYLSGKGVLFVVDASGDLLCKVLKYRPFLIKPNLQELEEIFGCEIKNEKQLLHYAGQLQNSGAENVLVSLAGDGAALLDQNGKFHRTPALQGTVKNSVGAGDSMVAGFLAGYFESQDFGYALKMGTAAGSATAFSGDLAPKEDILRLFAQIQHNQDL